MRRFAGRGVGLFDVLSLHRVVPAVSFLFPLTWVLKLTDKSNTLGRSLTPVASAPFLVEVALGHPLSKDLAQHVSLQVVLIAREANVWQRSRRDIDISLRRQTPEVESVALRVCGSSPDGDLVCNLVEAQVPNIPPQVGIKYCR